MGHEYLAIAEMYSYHCSRLTKPRKTFTACGCHAVWILFLPCAVNRAEVNLKLKNQTKPILPSILIFWNEDGISRQHGIYISHSAHLLKCCVFLHHWIASKLLWFSLIVFQWVYHFNLAAFQCVHSKQHNGSHSFGKRFLCSTVE